MLAIIKENRSFLYSEIKISESGLRLAGKNGNGVGVEVEIGVFQKVGVGVDSDPDPVTA
jgi:hypothetical protein